MLPSEFVTKKLQARGMEAGEGLVWLVENVFEMDLVIDTEFQRLHFQHLLCSTLVQPSIVLWVLTYNWEGKV